ncbi:MAG: hypothetical protein K6G18_08340 [Treponema sp.]|nr:hypothetical protein [Treponema sp.]
MAKPRIQAYAAFVFALFSSIILPISCNGNGGGSDSSGPIYMPVGGTSSGTAGGSGSPGSDSTASAQDILELSNAGDTDSIIHIFTASPEQEQAGTPQAVVLKASDIGLPEGGSATLAISGSISFSQTAQADADGNVSFQIPAIVSGTDITVSLSVRNASGTVLYSGSNQQTVSGDSINISLTLRRQFWTLPDSISVTASPDGLVFDSSQLDSASTTLTISGLEGAPAGAAIGYAWTDEAGLAVGSGATLTRTLGELVDSTAMTAGSELTRTYTVTVAYTDEGGTAKTASASTTVVVGPPVTIPAFTVKITPPFSYDTAHSNTLQYALVNGTDPFTFEPELPSGTEFPDGTVFSWSISKVGGTAPVTSTGTSISKTPAELGVAASVATWNITCTATNSRATDPVTADKTMQARILALPNFIIQLDSVTGYNADNSSGDTYAFMPSASGAFNFKAQTTSSTTVTGMTYSWSVSGSSSFTQTGDTCTVQTSDLPNFDSKTYASPGDWTVSCTLSYGSLDPVTKTYPLSAFVLALPDIKLTDNTSLPIVTAAASSTKFYVWDTGSETLSYTVESDDPDTPIPVGVTYSWSIGDWSESDGSFTETPAVSSVNTSSSSPLSGPDYVGTARCTISMAGLSKSTPYASLNLLSKGSMSLAEPDVTISAGTGLSGSGGSFTIQDGYTDESAFLSFTFSEDQPIEEFEYEVKITAGAVITMNENAEYFSSISVFNFCPGSGSPGETKTYSITIQAKSTVPGALNDSSVFTTSISITY